MSLARSILRTWGAGLCWFFTAAILVILLSHLPLGRVRLPLAPGTALALTALCFHLLAEGIRLRWASKFSR